MLVAATLASVGLTSTASAQTTQLTMSFGATTMRVGETTTLTFTIRNNYHYINLVGFTDALPAGLVIASPSGLNSSCDGTVTAGGSLLRLENATLSPVASCTLSVNVTATSPGVKVNTTSVLTSSIGTGNSATASVTVLAGIPTIGSIGPNTGSTLGGTAVTITGTNLTDIVGVVVGGVAAASVTVISPTTIIIVTPPHAAGLVDIAVTTPGGTATMPSVFTYFTPAPTIGSISPNTGSTLGGTSITVTGTNLTGATAVTIGGVAATSFTVLNATTIIAITPAHAAGPVDVSVTTAGGTATSGAIFIYAVPAPIIGSISPTSGSTLGGTTITITGTNLTGATAVTVGGIAATSFTVVSATIITAVTPAHAAGIVDIVIVTPGGSVTGSGTFTYVTPPPTVGSISPNTGIISGGTLVTITGTNLIGVISVTIGGVAATNITVINSTTITVITPAHAVGTYDVAITTPGGMVTMPSLFTYVTPAPTVSNISPTSGTTLGGTLVTITGANFTGAVGLTIGGVAASNVTIINTSTIVAVTGARAAGTVDVAVTNATGTAAGASLYTYIQQGSTTAATSSANPSSYGQLVTFTATVSGGGGGTPTGTITFKNGTTTIGTATLNGAGQATYAISSLSIGSHSITAAYGGDGTFNASTSIAIAQVVGVPADSAKLSALQAGVTKMVAQGSGQAISGAIDGAIAEGFNDGGDLIMPSDNGVRVNLSAEPPRRSADERVGESFAALGGRDNVMKSPMRAPPPPPRDWLAWAEVRGTGWNTGTQTGDIRGGQTNAFLGLTRRVTPNFLLGVFGGYEVFDYSSQTLNGRLKGDGWTVGGYIGWRIFPGLRFDAGVARSGISYDGTAGVATASFPGQRWLVSSGLTGTYRTLSGFEIEPSARVYALWEHESAYTDNLGIQHADRDFSAGRASAGAKVAYPWLWSTGTVVAPYAGVYGDYYFNKDDATLLTAPNLLPIEYVQGLSARVVSGVSVTMQNGPRFLLGGELGGIGNDFKVWSVRGRAAVPF